MFGDEARFGRMNRPRPCWAPIGIRPKVASQLIREYVYLYGAVSPKDGTCVYLVMPAPDTECFQIFLETVAKKYYKELILLFVDGAGNHCSDELEIPANIILHLLPPYSPELNPQENLWDEIREKIFKCPLDAPPLLRRLRFRFPLRPAKLPSRFVDAVTIYFAPALISGTALFAVFFAPAFVICATVLPVFVSPAFAVGKTFLPVLFVPAPSRSAAPLSLLWR